MWILYILALERNVDIGMIVSIRSSFWQCACFLYKSHIILVTPSIVLIGSHAPIKRYLVIPIAANITLQLFMVILVFCVKQLYIIIIFSRTLAITWVFITNQDNYYDKDKYLNWRYLAATLQRNQNLIFYGRVWRNVWRQGSSLVLHESEEKSR